MDNQVKVPTRVAEVNAEIQRQGNKTYSVAPSAPTYISPQAPTTISSASLASETPISLPNPTPPPTTGAGLSGEVTSKITTDYNNLQNELKTAQDQAKQQMQETKGGLLQSLGLKSSAVQEKADAYKSPEFLAKQKSVNDAYSEVQKLDAAQRSEMEALNAQGLTGQGSQDAQAGITRKYSLARANLAVVYDVANRDYQSAIENIDRAAALKQEAVQPYIDYYSQILQSDTSNFNQKERDVLDLKLNEYQKQQSDITAVGEIMKTIVGNGVQLSPQDIKALNYAKTPQEAISYLASRGIDTRDPLAVLEKRLQIQKLQAETNKIVNENKGTTVDVSKLDDRGKALLANVKNLRFSSVEESKRIIGNISARLAQGDIQGAVDDLKEFGYQKLSSTQKTDYDNYAGAISAFDSASNQMDVQNITAGPYKALAEKTKPYTSIKNDKAYADLRSIIELGQAQLRKGFYGTAVTGTEAANARNFLIQDSDTIQVIGWKLENGKNFLEFTNDASIARQVGLPKPNLDDYLTYRVRDKATGQTGTINRSEYNADQFEIINQ